MSYDVEEFVCQACGYDLIASDSSQCGYRHASVDAAYRCGHDNLHGCSVPVAKRPADIPFASALVAGGVQINYPIEFKATAFEKWNFESGFLITLLDDGVYDLYTIKQFVAVAHTCFHAGWEAAKVDSGDLNAAASALIAYLAPHVGSTPLYGADFAAVWYPMQEALLKAWPK